MNKRKLYLATIILSVLAILCYIYSPIFNWIYEDYKVDKTVSDIFKINKYEDIFLDYCYEEKCFYSFGEEMDHIHIYTVGREDIEYKIELSREIAKAWPTKNYLCEVYHATTCKL